MDRNPPFNPDAKIFYRPIEVAVRWCNLLAFEEEIISTTLKSSWPSRFIFPQWPCLSANTEKILDATRNGELAYGSLGKTVQPNVQVEAQYLTVRHTDLKLWMNQFYPDQKPSFLFDIIERRTHQAINLDSFQALQAERMALESKVSEWQNSHQSLLQKKAELEQEKEQALKRLSSQGAEFNERSEAANLNIIGSLLHLLLAESPSGKPYSSFRSQTAIISSITAHFSGQFGITERTLERKFAAAKRSLNKR